MKTKVLICAPEEYEKMEEEFLKECYKQLNTEENNCDDCFFYSLTNIKHNGSNHYFEFVYDRYMD